MRTPTYWMLVLASGLRNTAHSGLSFLLGPGDGLVPARGGAGADGKFADCRLLRGSGRHRHHTVQSGDWLAGRPVPQETVDRHLHGLRRGFLDPCCSTPLATLWQLAGFAILLALSESANSLNWAMMGEFFGRRNFATLRGWQHLPDQLMSMWTAVWMGMIYDRTGSYFWALFPLIALFGLATLTYPAPAPSPAPGPPPGPSGSYCHRRG